MADLVTVEGAIVRSNSLNTTVPLAQVARHLQYVPYAYSNIVAVRCISEELLHSLLLTGERTAELLSFNTALHIKRTRKTLRKANSYTHGLLVTLRNSSMFSVG